MVDVSTAAFGASRWKTFWTGFKAACEAMETMHGEYQEKRIGLMEQRLIELEATVKCLDKN